MKDLFDSYLKLDWGIRIIIFLFLGWFIGFIYRFYRYSETKNNSTLIYGILYLLLPVLSWVDFISLLVNKDEFKYLCE